MSRVTTTSRAGAVHHRTALVLPPWTCCAWWARRPSFLYSTGGLALIGAAAGAIIGFGLRRFNAMCGPSTGRVRDRLGDIGTRLQDDLTGIPRHPSIWQEDAELERFRTVSETLLRER